MALLDTFINKYQTNYGGTVQREGRSYRITCPNHGGNSLIVSEESGKILLNCMGGEACNTPQGKADMVRRMGMKWTDLFEDGSKYEKKEKVKPESIEPPIPATLERLADKTGLTVDYLQSVGVSRRFEGGRESVAIRYIKPDGSPAERQRVRLYMNGKGRFKWEGDYDAKPIPYVLDYSALKGDVFVVEGESDTWTLHYHGQAVIGITGAEATGTLTYDLIKDAKRLFVVKEKDEGGEKFVRRLAERLAQFPQWKGTAYVIDPPEGCKDTNDAYKSGQFFQWMNEVLDGDHQTLAEYTGIEVERRFSFKHLVNVLELPPLRWLIEGILPEHSLSMIYGPPEQYKTFMALDIALHLATGKPWKRRSVRGPTGVLYIAAEGTHGLKKRIDAWLRVNKYDSLKDIPFYVLPEAVNMSDTETIAHLCAEMPDHVGFIVIDTLHSMMEGDENSAKDVKRFIDGLRTIQKMRDVSIMIIHHSGKEGTKERGSTSLRGAMDTMIEVTKEVKLSARIKCTKQKDFERFETFWVDGEIVELDDGETSLVFSISEDEDKEKPPSIIQLGETKKKIVQVLQEAREEDEEGGWLTPREIIDRAGIDRKSWDNHRMDLINNGYIKKHEKENKYCFHIQAFRY